MVIKTDQDRVKTLLKDTITLLCKNGLAFKRKFSIDAVIGVTIDEDDVFLVSMNELVKTDVPPSPTSSDGDDRLSIPDGQQRNHKRQRKRKYVKTEQGAESFVQPQEIMGSSDEDNSGNFPHIEEESSEFHGIHEIKRQHDNINTSQNINECVDNRTGNKMMQIKEEVDDSVWTGSHDTGSSQLHNTLPDFATVTNFSSDDLSNVNFLPPNSQEQWLQQSNLLSSIHSSSMSNIPRTSTVTSEPNMSQSDEGQESMNMSLDSSQQVSNIALFSHYTY